MRREYVALLLLSLTSACCRHTYDDHVGWVPQLIEERYDSELFPDPCIEDLLAVPLTVNSAVQIALLNNPKIQQILADVGIAHADLVKSGLWKNPVLYALIRFPDKAIYFNNVEYGIAAAFLDICLAQLRRQVASVEYMQVQLRVANAILDTVFEVEETFYCLQALERRQAAMKDLVELADICHELALRQAKHGNINDIALSVRSANAIKTQLELRQLDLQVASLREKLNRSFGIPSRGCWTLSNVDMVMPDVEWDTCSIEELALETRLDLMAMRWECDKLDGIKAQNQAWAYTNLQFGISHARDSEGISALGPTLSIDLPLFNDGSVERCRLHTLCVQNDYALTALEIDIRSEVRQSLERFHIAQHIVERYQHELIPLQEAVIPTGTIYYNSMGYGLYALLDNKAQVIQSQMDCIDAIKDYYLAYVALDRAVGGRFFSLFAQEETVCDD